MANGTILVPTQQIETGTPTIIWNKASIASWGFLRYAKYGKLVIVTWSGLRFSQNVTSPTPVIELPYSSAFDLVVTISKDTACIVQMSIDRPNQIIFNGYSSANATIYGELVYLTND